jgi:hypothetical protein
MDRDASEQGSSKPETPYKEGNTGADGQYIVGRNKPPAHGRFAKGDGRKRGRRAKGQKNFDTEFAEEAARMITIRENGKERRVTKLRSAIVRVFDNAGAKGQNQAIAAIFNHGSRIAEKQAPTSQGLSREEHEQLDAWIVERAAEITNDTPQADGDVEGSPEETSGEGAHLNEAPDTGDDAENDAGAYAGADAIEGTGSPNADG